MPGGQSLLCHFVVGDRGDPPAPPTIPAGPVIQESEGEAAPSWTFQDLLENGHDEALYDYYLTSQPALVDAVTGETRAVGAPAVYESLQPSPGGEYLLSVRTVRPYSYLVPDARFTKEVEVLDRAGRTLRALGSVRNIMHLRGGGGERLAGPVHLLEDLRGRLRPDERPGVLVVGLDVLLQARF